MRCSTEDIATITDTRKKEATCLLCAFPTWTSVPREEHIANCVNERPSKKKYKLPLSSNMDAGVVCRRCGKFVCRECVLIMRTHFLKHKVKNIPENFSTIPTSPRLYVDVGHCCSLCVANQKQKHDVSCQSRGFAWPTLLVHPPMTVASIHPPPPIWPGALHLYQYNAVVGSTPPTDIDVFLYGSLSHYASITHGLFHIPTTLSLHDVVPKAYLLNGTFVEILRPLSVDPFPHPFNHCRYCMMVYTIRRSRMDDPVMGSHPGQDEAAQATLLHPLQHNHVGYDGAIVLRDEGGNKYSLLLTRFFLSAPLFSKPELFLMTVKNEKKTVL